MRKIFGYLWILMLWQAGYGQGQNNIWTFGNHYSLDFNHNPPLLRDTTYVNGTVYQSQNATTMYPTEHQYNYAQAVCDAGGSLLFIVKRYTYTRNGQDAPCIFDKNEVPIAGTAFLQTNDMEYSRPVIIPRPGNSNQYYIFYVRNGGLIYCLFDITLNNGRGNIVPGYKNVLAYTYNTLIGCRMVAIAGCDGIWLVARHRTYNQYLSFKVTSNGVSSNPVVSEIGSFPVMNYWGSNGILAVSPNGKKVATAVDHGGILNFPGGLEMYDFEKCSGKLKNLQVIDTGEKVYAVCFSPDNSKLYAGYAIPWANGEWKFDQYVYQFDLNQSSLSAITASKSMILTNPYAQYYAPFCPITTNIMGNMQIGPDGKIYLGNSHPEVCEGTGPGLALHVISFPNNLGISSNPQVNAIWNQWNGMGSLAITDLPYQMVLPKSGNIDTLNGNSNRITVCFKTDTLIETPEGISCYRWENGSTNNHRTITEDGHYLLYYTKDCSVFIDTYSVVFIPLPEVKSQQYGCPGNISLQAGKAGNRQYDYTLRNGQGLVVHAASTDSVFQTSGLEEGIYKLQISSSEGCTTSIDISLTAYPKPEVSISPAFAEIINGELITLRASGATYYTWKPISPLDNSFREEVLASPTENTTFSVVGINDYGCWDTAYSEIIVNADERMIMPNAFTPNGDGLNDLFKIPGDHFTIRRFEIYNRYGQIVYQDSGNNNGWDGNFNGAASQQGVYQYYIILDFYNGNQKILKGDINLIR